MKLRHTSHLNREVYRRYEKGEREIPVWAVIQLARLYGTSTDYIPGLVRPAMILLWFTAGGGARCPAGGCICPGVPGCCRWAWAAWRRDFCSKG